MKTKIGEIEYQRRGFIDTSEGWMWQSKVYWVTVPLLKHKKYKHFCKHQETFGIIKLKGKGKRDNNYYTQAIGFICEKDAITFSNYIKEKEGIKK